MDRRETLDDIKNRIGRELISSLDGISNVSDEFLLERIDEAIVEEARSSWIPLSERILLRVNLFNSLRKLDVLQEFLEDDTVSEIMVNGYDRIFLEREGRIVRSDRAFSSEEKLQNVIQQIVSRVNRTVNESNPVVDARLEDGSRVNIVLKSVALDGPAVTIRKFGRSFFSLDALIASGTLTEEAGAFLKDCVKKRKNIFISGGTGTGKTTFLNALSACIPDGERIITIEDSAELQLQHAENLVRMEAKPGNGEGDREITIRELIRTALRMRPDRIIVGECRGAEAIDMLQSMNTGHDGSLSTGHARSALDMLARLETMASFSGELPLSAIREQIGSAIDILVHLSRNREGRRQVDSILEVKRFAREKNEYETRILFQREENGELSFCGEGTGVGAPSGISVLP